MAGADEKDRAEDAAALPTGPIAPSTTRPDTAPRRGVPEHAIEEDQAAEGERKGSEPPLKQPQVPVQPGAGVAPRHSEPAHPTDEAGAASLGSNGLVTGQAVEKSAEKSAEKQAAKPTAQSRAPENDSPPARAGIARPVDPNSADDVLTKRIPGHDAADGAVLAASRQHTRRSFALAAVGAAAGYGFYRWVGDSPDKNMLQAPLRRALGANAALSRGVFDDRALAPTYPLARAENLRVNGVVGLGQNLVPASWRLQVVGVRDAAQHPSYTRDLSAWEYRYTRPPGSEDKGHDTKTAPKADTARKMAPASTVGEQEKREKRGNGEAGESRSTVPPGTPGLLLTLDQLTKLPRRELVTQFKCIEGWSQIVHWAGVRMADFLEAYPPALVNGREPKYVYMETPNGDYYCGYDLYVCRHPQTLLVTEMMGQPLTPPHGAPLRLHMPTKYGYKQIKRIGLIAYTDSKPDDYWTKLGYDWYAGL